MAPKVISIKSSPSSLDLHPKFVYIFLTTGSSQLSSVNIISSYKEIWQPYAELHINCRDLIPGHLWPSQFLNTRFSLPFNHSHLHSEKILHRFRHIQQPRPSQHPHRHSHSEHHYGHQQTRQSLPHEQHNFSTISYHHLLFKHGIEIDHHLSNSSSRLAVCPQSSPRVLVVKDGKRPSIYWRHALISRTRENSFLLQEVQEVPGWELLAVQEGQGSKRSSVQRGNGGWRHC